MMSNYRKIKIPEDVEVFQEDITTIEEEKDLGVHVIYGIITKHITKSLFYFLYLFLV